MVKKVNSNTYENGDSHTIGGNSVVFTKGDFVNNVGGYLIASTVGGNISGVVKETATMASDNQTVAMAKVMYEVQKDSTTYEVTITGGTVTIVDEGKFYDLATVSTVDGTTESATTGQLQLVKFITATSCLFKIVNA